MAATPKTLTAVAASKAKPRERTYRLAAGEGLYLEVVPSGAKYWRWKYRHAGKEKRIALGVFPEVALADARQRRDEERAKLREGVDPLAQRKARKLAAHLAAENSFEAIANEWLETKVGEWVPATGARVRAWLDQHVNPWIGAKPIAELEAPELLAMLRKVVKRGTLDTAGRIRETLSTIFRYAIATGRAKRDPAADLRDALPKPDSRNFAAITEPAAVAELLRAIEGFQGQPVTLAALRLAPLLFQRPGELRAAEWSEIDLDAGEWRIPASRRKLSKAAKENPRTPPHIVPLSKQAVAILRELHRLTGTSRLVFPGVRDSRRPMSENTVNAGLRRLGYTTEQMTGHGFRHMASTRLNELGWNPDAIERQLSHRDRDSIRGTYNLAQYMAERRKMMQAWADYLDALRTGAIVVPIKRKAR
ncbi:tyrosine-type recombinase/integrase [Dokdonella soli]|uniref:Tyrosine-type recombinase/integrase n=2 Tax=Dokdonella soli TaxID=529810 RepID=A0ABN1ID17_9GAMM